MNPAPAFQAVGVTVAFRRKDRLAKVVKDFALSLFPGTISGLAGESGSGKSTAVLSALGYAIPGAVVLGGSAVVDGVDLLRASPAQLRELWGRSTAYVSQDASQSLDPLMKVSAQLAEPQRLHLGLHGANLTQHSIELLSHVGIPNPEAALDRYPHQFSGGQQQRIALAIAISCRPKVLILDEPTTGLDVTTQAQVLALIRRLVTEDRMAAVMISHDLSLLATICDDLSIMYAGEIVEQGAAESVYSAPRHPYSAALIDAVPRVDEPVLVVGIPGLPPMEAVDDRCPFAPRCRFAREECRHIHPPLEEIGPHRRVRCVRTTELGVIRPLRTSSHRSISMSAAGHLLEVSDLVCRYPGRHSLVAVQRVSLSVGAGETVGLVGESGSGKSTLLRAIAGLHPPAGGSITFSGSLLPKKAVKRPAATRRRLQIVFQDPHSSLNPRQTVAEIIGRPLQIFHPELGRRRRAERLVELLDEVKLDHELVRRFPHQLSGGQKQRVGLARAFATDPDLILCDEVVSALDVSVQASILELLVGLATSKGTALLFVTHDLAVVRSIADRIYVMNQGSIVEEGPTEDVFSRPQSGYTTALLAAIPRPGAGRMDGIDRRGLIVDAKLESPYYRSNDRVIKERE